MENLGQLPVSYLHPSNVDGAKHNWGILSLLVKRLNAITTKWRKKAEGHFYESGEKVRRIYEFRYGAKSWRCSRRIIAKIERTEKGPNTRYVVTNLDGKPQLLYDKIYCARGDMENRIKKTAVGLIC